MADQAAQLEALKAAASNHESQVETAATKDEALKQALAAAEKLMMAVKLTTDPSERKQLNSRFNAIADIARSVKSNEWTRLKPPVAKQLQPQHQVVARPKSKADGIGQWATDVAQSLNHIPDGCHSQSTPTTQIAASNKRVAPQTVPPQTKSLTASPPHHPAAIPAQENPNHDDIRVGHNGVIYEPQFDLAARHDPKSWAQEITRKEPPLISSNTSVSHVRKLREPISSRKRTTKEEIILLKASLVNGVKCPPWDKIPSANEFGMNGPEHYTEPRDLTLSSQQQQHFKAWTRAKDAVSQRSSGSAGTPVMSSPRPIDLVQDAATDCSVVASLCAGIARTERGYDKVRRSYVLIDIVPDQLWKRLHQAFAFGDVLATLGTGQMSTRQERELGLEGQHSYVVLDMKETSHDRFLLVKNPWVEGRGWLGPRPTLEELYAESTISDSSKDGLATYHRDTIPTKDRPNPTTFWIGLEQVIRHFESLYLNWNPGLFRYRQDIHFEWTVDGSSEEENRCIVKHPQFLFHSNDASPVWFLLSRHFRATSGDNKEESDAFNDGSIRPSTLIDTCDDVPKGFMSIFVCPGNGNCLYIKDTCLERSDYVTTPQCLLRWDPKANSTYTVVIDQDELPASAYTFSLFAFSNSKIELEPAIPRFPLQRVVTGEWTKQTAGGGTGSSQYFQNPQYALEVKERGPLAILLTSANRKNALHVKLTLGHGKRIYRLNSRDVLADSGDHRIRCAFAEAKDLESGMYTIVCSLFEAGQTGDYSLRVDSTHEIGLEQIPRDGAGLILNRLAPVCFRPEVNEVVAPMAIRRLAAYTIVVRFLKATTSRSTGVLPTTRSPLRFSVEYGRGPERQFLITSERGQYSDAVILRTEAIDIDPELYPGANLFLVMDRLSGPGGPVEEWYEVEVYTDIPSACDIGVWRNKR
ncbi:cysteine protease [Paraconiothyrium brasiliense]|uniref:Cysteine protease n=1 Tax=Paraconiothyrium brasiliense TaxID=300254 RepID=A0ABR3RC13_9PLEO